jgi:hypothetical protein
MGNFGRKEDALRGSGQMNHCKMASVTQKMDGKPEIREPGVSGEHRNAFDAARHRLSVQ